MGSVRPGKSVAAMCAAIVLVVGVASCDSRYGASLDRADDPVVLTGADTPNLIGADPRHVVGFSWDGSTWHQIPVQVDERDLVSPGEILHMDPANYPKLKGTSTLYKILVYTPAASSNPDYTVYESYTPADSDPKVDADDEIAFMAYDTGKVAPAEAGSPAGVDVASRQIVTATDPLNSSKSGTVYLFTSSTLTGGSGGTSGVNYTLTLTRGGYKAMYRMGGTALPPNDKSGPNPETSTVVTPSYQLGYSDRWVNNAMTMSRVDSNGDAMVDRTNYFATGVGCLRNEDTFSGAQGPIPGAFIANISGPVRAIRSYMGANSFTFTNVTDVFYPSREDTTVHLIGHVGMPGFGIATDLATGLTGMTYTDAKNSGLVIDGVPPDPEHPFVPQSADTGSEPIPPSWQMVQGPAGTVVSARTLDTDIEGLHMTSTFVDNASVKPCTGDASSWGRHGYEINSPTNSVPATDPTLEKNPKTFTSTGYRYFLNPHFSAADAPALELQVKNPIVTSVSN